MLSLVLAAALLHASWNALVKAGGDPFVRLAVVIAVGGLCTLPLLFVVEPPARASWPYLAGSVVVHHAYYLSLGYGYRFGDLSHVYPIARGIAPPLVACAAWAFAGESMGLLGLLAILIISAGIVSLAFTDDGRLAALKPLMLGLVNGITIAAYTLFDGLGGRASSSVLGYIAWLFVISSVPFSVIVAYRYRHRLGPALAAVVAAGGARRCPVCGRLRAGDLGDDPHADGRGLGAARDQRDHCGADRHPSAARAVRHPTRARGRPGRRRRRPAPDQPRNVMARSAWPRRLDRHDARA